ncbi:MAG: hypothetical protein IT462_02865 [Planctomycetes bacterium]|nr:hypothetical protein [Planctomycetota bacterium]
MASRSADRSGVKATRVATNFIDQYGMAKFRRFLKLLADDVSGEEIAREYRVSRERVRQWKITFGSVVRKYVIDPAIQRIAGK